MNKYQKPTLILNKIIEGEEIYWEGSGRGCGIEDTRQFLIDTNLVEFAEGHAQAFGVKIKDSNCAPLIEYINKALKNFDFSPCYKIDFIYNVNLFNSKDILQIADLKSLWGKGVEEPLVLIQDLKITKNNLHLMSPDNKPTLKINLSKDIEIIKFKSSKEEYENLLSDGYTLINVIGKCSKNEWNGKITAQIIVDDYEIKEKYRYYF